MQYRTFTVPFAEVVGESPELEFGPDDFLVVRPLPAYPVSQLSHIQPALAKVGSLSETESQVLLVDVLALTIKGWHLATPDGEIAQPRDLDGLNALPPSLKSSLLPFLLTYRGKGADPTPAA